QATCVQRSVRNWWVLLPVFQQLAVCLAAPAKAEPTWLFMHPFFFTRAYRSSDPRGRLSAQLSAGWLVGTMLSAISCAMAGIRVAHPLGVAFDHDRDSRIYGRGGLYAENSQPSGRVDHRSRSGSLVSHKRAGSAGLSPCSLPYAPGIS